VAASTDLPPPLPDPCGKTQIDPISGDAYLTTGGRETLAMSLRWTPFMPAGWQHKRNQT